MELGESGYLEKSMLASRDHVFLSWHDIEFVVPAKKEIRSNAPKNAKEAARVKWIEKHQERASYEKKDGEKTPVDLINLTVPIANTNDASVLHESIGAYPSNTKTVLHRLSGFAAPG